ncbi:serine hydrolase domain-containing protein [Algoriphagus antarcticus]|uniref:CubicO group peptidase (Beta-lactamase class C family) n=1 Tax=Algoriphagus antarcticus TaxID=238540 RepID=A0A3E0DG99_9BACT|nr:serine hydrolase domain-containing protein [Algoriphagus antarcticus]REG81715.1 CubicO group peptidase (beta-lactamase class C family) [Algoriphagus antarcticus]
MKTATHFSAILALQFLFFSFTAHAQEKKSEETSHFFSSNYQMPVFEQDQRAEKIKEILPELEALMAKYAKDNHIPGIAYGIVVDNELVLASSTGLLDVAENIPAQTTSAFRIASMTKSFTAMAILKLRDEGKLLLSDPASKYIPEMSKLHYLTEDAPIIDIENLLTMTAGFPEDNPWGDRQLNESDQMLLNLISEGISFSNAPSLQYEYSNTGYAILGHIISTVSGQPYQEYINENILLPLEMAHTYWEIDNVPENQLALGYRWEDEQWKQEPMLHDGAFGAMGGLITSIEDFSKYVRFHLSAWPPRNGTETGPIERSSLREMQTPQFPRLNTNGDCAIMSGYGFGLGIYQNCNGTKWVSHGGALPGFGSNYRFYPEYGVGIMAFCNLTYTTPWPLAKIEALLYEKGVMEPRKLPVSDILEKRKNQLVMLIQTGNKYLEESILAENFFLDRSKEHRFAEYKAILEQAGEIKNVSPLKPENQLRGSFQLEGENGDVEIFFTLTPEKDPKVQQLDVNFKEK